jgi:hypothetical protein
VHTNIELLELQIRMGRQELGTFEYQLSDKGQKYHLILPSILEGVKSNSLHKTSLCRHIKHVSKPSNLDQLVRSGVGLNAEDGSEDLITKLLAN